jgi:hypothetical protein
MAGTGCCCRPRGTAQGYWTYLLLVLLAVLLLAVLVVRAPPQG